MRRFLWLAHPDPAVNAHPVFEVRNNPIRIFSRFIAPVDIPIEVLVGPAPSGVQGVDYEWVPLVRAGTAVVLNGRHNTYMEFIPGYYRVDPAAIPPDCYISAVEDEASTDDRGMVLVEEGTLLCQRDLPV